MEKSIKHIFEYYLGQLERIVSKIPDEMFSLSLTDDMLSLEQNAKVAANFALRGYCPLLNLEVVSFFNEAPGKAVVQKQLSDTLAFLRDLPEIQQLDEKILLPEKAGFANIELPKPLFIHQYILPNFFFHMSMVYAIAKSPGVKLGKGDFDGLHSYPENFHLG